MTGPFPSLSESGNALRGARRDDRHAQRVP